MLDMLQCLRHCGVACLRSVKEIEGLGEWDKIGAAVVPMGRRVAFAMPKPGLNHPLLQGQKARVERCAQVGRKDVTPLVGHRKMGLQEGKDGRIPGAKKLLSGGVTSGEARHVFCAGVR
jgi:hypothetical protein